MLAACPITLQTRYRAIWLHAKYYRCKFLQPFCCVLSRQLRQHGLRIACRLFFCSWKSLILLVVPVHLQWIAGQKPTGNIPYIWYMLANVSKLYGAFKMHLFCFVKPTVRIPYIWALPRFKIHRPFWNEILRSCTSTYFMYIIHSNGRLAYIAMWFAQSHTETSSFVWTGLYICQT